MLNKVRKIEKRGNEVYFLNQMGYVVSIPINDYDVVMKHASKKRLTNKMPKIVKDLADAQILIFDNYKPNENNVDFDDALVTTNDEKPIYKTPIIAHLSITSACNMNCKYCSVRSIHTKLNQLSTDECKKIIDKLVDWGVFQIGLTGGEPTTRSDLVELVRYTSSKNVACNLTTNGWHITQKLVDQLADAGLTQVQLSLDSHIEEEHEKYRNKGSYKRVMESALMFKKKGLIVGFDTVVTNDNLNKIEKMIKFLNDKGYDGLTLLKLKQGDLSLEDFKRLVPEYKKYGELIDKICKYNGHLDVTLDCGSVCNLCMTLTEEEAKTLHSAGCPAGHTLVHVDSNGDMYPCAGLSKKEFKFGNILTDDPSDVWNNNNVLKQMRDIKKMITGKCKKCPKLDNCRGGCRAISYSFGNLLGSDETCNIKLS
jgi:radical SAM protein with 4Fe4S-binding SPASM domain